MESPSDYIGLTYLHILQSSHRCASVLGVHHVQHFFRRAHLTCPSSSHGRADSAELCELRLYGSDRYFRVPMTIAADLRDLWPESRPATVMAKCPTPKKYYSSSQLPRLQEATSSQ